jgi:Tfp pilus assembly protein PilF
MTLLKEFPDEVLYNGLLADIYRGKGENANALEVYDKMLNRNPDSGQIQLALCDFLISEKDYEGIFRILNIVILNNKIEVENKISLVARIIDLPDLSKYDDRLMVILMVFEATYNKNDVVPLLRTDYLIHQNKLIEAAERLKEIIGGNQDNYFAWEKLLVIYLQIKDFKNLFKTGEECATKFNRSFPAKLLYANGALELGKFSVALEELKKAEILATDNKESLIQVLTMRADVYYRMKDYLKAFETFEAAIKADNQDLTVINNYAYYLAEQNRNLKEAERMAKRVIEKEKDNTTFLDTYGWVLYKRGKLKEAARIMEFIISKGDSTDAVWYEHYGYILKKQNKCDEAVKNWNIALKIDGTRMELLREIENCKK